METWCFAVKKGLQFLSFVGKLFSDEHIDWYHEVLTAIWYRRYSFITHMELSDFLFSYTNHGDDLSMLKIAQ